MGVRLMIKALEPIFHQINTILSKYGDDDNIISKLKNLMTIVQVEISKLPEGCEFADQCREESYKAYGEPEPIDIRSEID